ncbi:MAG: GNAT family N-acetyltransferase [Muribaculum sp.]|nr:GNAT family N-acetyltransferase [Muribaculum sp.]
MNHIKYYLKKVILLPIKGKSAAEPDASAKGPDAPDGQAAEEAVLYITDDSPTARRLLAQGRAVLVYLHAGNRDADFSFCKYACEDPTELDLRYLDRIYRRYRAIPWDILETERCLVRETTVEDVDDFYRIYSVPSITKYMEPLYEDPEEERAYARDYIEQVYAFYEFGMWTVVDKSSGEVIGRAGLCFREGYEDPELGFVIAADRQGQGLATEVCGAILRYGGETLGFGKIQAFVQPDNAASLRVCGQLGMKKTGHARLQGKEYLIYVWEDHSPSPVLDR